MTTLAAPIATVPPRAALYDPREVRGLFDRMSSSYDRMNLVMSLGFSALWRRQLLDLVSPVAGARAVLDLMSGRGETWSQISRRFPDAAITALDFSEAMTTLAVERNHADFDGRVTIRCEDALDSSLPDASADAIVSAFGVKTLDAQQSRRLADEVARLLRPGGTFAFIEITEPPNPVLRFAYRLYLRCIVPIAGILLLSDPTEYRMLHRYLEDYGDGERAAHAFTGQPSLHVEVRRHFFGCATSISGRRLD